MSALAAVADRLTIPRRGPLDLRHEARDIHEIDAILADDVKFATALSRHARAAPMLRAAAQPVQGKVIPGMGRVWDYRAMTEPNGGRIVPQIFTQHIPVVRNVVGRADLDTLWRVLLAQGLMVQAATDAEGNVALYTSLDRLCYQARGANQLGPGVEHMHFGTSEEWTSKQMNAAAWLLARMKRNHGVPMYPAILTPGPGIVGYRRRGQTSHMEVSAKAGFHDRTDPGPGYVFSEIRERAIRFYRTGKF
jgi:hypothetical protein